MAAPEAKGCLSARASPWGLRACVGAEGGGHWLGRGGAAAGGGRSAGLNNVRDAAEIGGADGARRGPEGGAEGGGPCLGRRGGYAAGGGGRCAGLDRVRGAAGMGGADGAQRGGPEGAEAGGRWVMINQDDLINKLKSEYNKFHGGGVAGGHAVTVAAWLEAEEGAQSSVVSPRRGGGGAAVRRDERCRSGRPGRAERPRRVAVAGRRVGRLGSAIR